MEKKHTQVEEHYILAVGHHIPVEEDNQVVEQLAEKDTVEVELAVLVLEELKILQFCRDCIYRTCKFGKTNVQNWSIVLKDIVCIQKVRLLLDILLYSMLEDVLQDT